jgi:hypothetical protein
MSQRLLKFLNVVPQNSHLWALLSFITNYEQIMNKNFVHNLFIMLAMFKNCVHMVCLSKFSSSDAEKVGLSQLLLALVQKKLAYFMIFCTNFLRHSAQLIFISLSDLSKNLPNFQKETYFKTH